MRRNSSRRLALCGVALTACLACFWAVSATAVAAPGTFVDGPPTVHGSATVLNACTSTFMPPGATPPPSTLGISVSSDAGPQPPNGLDPVTLSNTTVKVSVPSSFLQSGIDAGIFGDGQSFPMTIAPVIAGSNTVEETQQFEETTTTTIDVVDGAVQPLTATVQLPDSIWHPARPFSEMSFAEKSVRVVILIDLAQVISPVTLTSDCAPSEERAFIVLGTFCAVAQADPCTTSTTGPQVSASDPTVLNQSTTVPGATTLPRTGSSSGYAVL